MGIPEALLPQRVTKVRPASTADTYGNAVPDYGDDATRTADIPGWLQQSPASEPRAEGRDATVATWLLMTNDTDLLAADHIEWAGPAGALVFEVDGPPEPVYTPAGLHHIEANLRIVTG